MSGVLTPAVAKATVLARNNDVPAAYEELERAIAAGDALAAATLAEWRISGQLIRRDIPAARTLFGRAAALGLASAVPIYIALLASGAGGAERRWMDALAALRVLASSDRMAGWQVELLNRMVIDDEGEPTAPLAREALSANPEIEQIRDFLTDEECRYIAHRALPLMQPSVVVDPANGQMIRDPVRTGQASGFPFLLEDPVLHAINRRIATATGTMYEQGEPLQVLGYSAGQEYRLHSDTLPPPVNQRIRTLLVRLNDGYLGGETDFPRLGLRWTGKAGEALSFVNVDRDGSAHPQAWHRGEPVRSGSKLLLSKWIRARPLDLAGPPGRPF